MSTSPVHRRSIEDHLVRRTKHADVVDVADFVAGDCQSLKQMGREIRVEQEPHAGRAIGTSRSFTIADAYSRAAVTSSRSR